MQYAAIVDSELRKVYASHPQLIARPKSLFESTDHKQGTFKCTALETTEIGYISGCDFKDLDAKDYQYWVLGDFVHQQLEEFISIDHCLSLFLLTQK